MHPVIGLEGIHRFLIVAPRLQEKAGGDAFRIGDASGHVPLLSDGGHVCPGIEHMGHPVPG